MDTPLNIEFNNTFDLLYNNIASNQAIGLDEYEKSVFLTNAQDEVVLSLYNNNSDVFDSFEKTEEIRRYLDSTIKTWESTVHYGYYSEGGFYEDKKHTLPIASVNNDTYIDVLERKCYICKETQVEETTSYSFELVTSVLEPTSCVFLLPDNLWFITYESASIKPISTCKCCTTEEVIPVTQDNYYKAKNNPFRGPKGSKVLRLESGSNQVELVSNKDIDTYKIRYIEKLKPIILEDLPEGLTIKGESKETECKLNSALHRAILNRAVKLAIESMAQTIQQ